jgi:hypothetical protein
MPSPRLLLLLLLLLGGSGALGACPHARRAVVGTTARVGHPPPLHDESQWCIIALCGYISCIIVG